MNVPETYYESPKQPLNIFTEYETMELLKLIEDPEIQKLFATYRKKHKYVWTLISNILAEKGINKSEDKCANRFENMKAKFFKIEKRRMQGYNDETEWPYYDFFVRFMSNSYMSNDLQIQHVPQGMFHQLQTHQTYNMSKVKIEPGSALTMMEPSYHENSDILRISNTMNHPYGFNTNGVPDIIQPTNQQDSKTSFQPQQDHQQLQLTERPQDIQQNRQEESQENTEIPEEEKQQVLISPQYVNNVERTDTENHVENSNESISNVSTSANSMPNNINLAKNINGTYSNIPQHLRKSNNRIPPNFNPNPNAVNSNFNAKFAKKFKKIKIDEELMAIRKEKYALELEILRFQLDNEKKLNEKHCLDLKILEEKLKSERYKNQLLQKELIPKESENSTDMVEN